MKWIREYLRKIFKRNINFVLFEIGPTRLICSAHIKAKRRQLKYKIRQVRRLYRTRQTTEPGSFLRIRSILIKPYWSHIQIWDCVGTVEFYSTIRHKCTVQYQISYCTKIFEQVVNKSFNMESFILERLERQGNQTTISHQTAVFSLQTSLIKKHSPLDFFGLCRGCW